MTPATHLPRPTTIASPTPKKLPPNMSPATAQFLHTPFTPGIACTLP